MKVRKKAKKARFDRFRCSKCGLLLKTETAKDNHEKKECPGPIPNWREMLKVPDEKILRTYDKPEIADQMRKPSQGGLPSLGKKR